MLSVSSGMVLTVPGTTSSSTYLIGLKSRILGGGRGPQQPLRPRAARGEASHCAVALQVLEDLVGAAGAGDRRLAAQRARGRLAVRGERIELLVDRGVDAAEEEARHRGDARRRGRPCARRVRSGPPCRRAPPRGSAPGENSSVTLTLMPAAIRSRITGMPASVPGILMSALGSCSRSHRRCASGEAAGGVVGEVRGDLHADEAVAAAAGVVQRPQQRGRVLAGPASASSSYSAMAEVTLRQQLRDRLPRSAGRVMMELAKIAGLEVSPAMPSSWMRRARLPSSSMPRLMSSSQALSPSLRSSSSGLGAELFMRTPCAAE